MPEENPIPLDKVVRTYVKIRDKRSELKADFDTEDTKLVSQMDTLKGVLLEHCKEHDVTSVKTSEGLFYRTVKQRYWTSDWESMHAFILEHQEPALLDKRINQRHMRVFLGDNPDVLPKGLNSESQYTISIRKK
tara:strand:- start:1418 stop:1819 length:402 start_codon:yes stop_codon:yes gene_type:complete